MASSNTTITIIKSYDDLYSRKDFVHFKQDRIYIQKLCALLTDPQKASVLDVGCGRGYWSQLFHECGVGRVVGIDISTVGLNIARREYPGVEFLLGDARHLQFNDQTFDLIFCQGLSEFNTTDLSKTRPVGLEILRCLKDNGWFVFASATNLSGKDSGSWVQHKPESIGVFLQSLGCEIAASYLIDRLIFLRFFRQYSINSFFSKLVFPIICRITRLRICMVVIARKKQTLNMNC
jgi:ubiquinone/menaquinone biosynthesis C-methylase UbiE